MRSVRNTIIEYTHSGNQELYISSVVWTTAEITFTQPHGITVGVIKDIIIVPQQVYPDGIILKTIPYEWANTASLQIKSTGANTAIVQNTSAVATTVTIGNANNANIDFSKFHLEIFTPWSLTGLNSRRIRLLLRGYVRQGYRYLRIMSQATDLTSAELTYVPALGSTLVSAAYFPNGFFSIEDWVIELIGNNFRYIPSTITMAVHNIAYTVGCVYTLNSAINGIIAGLASTTRTIDHITSLSAYANCYFECANGTSITLYNLDEDEKLTLSQSTLAVSNVFTLDLSQTYNFQIETLDTIAKSLVFSNIPATIGQIITVTATLKYTNNATMTYPAGTSWKDGNSPVLVAGKTYYLMFTTFDNGVTWLGSWVGAW